MFKGQKAFDIRNDSALKHYPASLPELETADRKEGQEGVTTVLTCCKQSPVDREGNGGAKSKCANWRLEPTRFSKLDTLSAATGQGVASDLQYVQSKREDKRTGTVPRRD